MGFTCLACYFLVPMVLADADAQLLINDINTSAKAGQ